VVKITIGGGAQLQCTEANLIEGFVIDTEGLIGVLNKLVDREGGIVRLQEDIDELDEVN